MAEEHAEKMQQLADELAQEELEKKIRKAREWTWAQEKDSEVTSTDIFQQQKSTIDTLIDVFAGGGGSQPQVVYGPPPEEKKPTNYVMYAGLALAAYFLLRKRG